MSIGNCGRSAGAVAAERRRLLHCTRRTTTARDRHISSLQGAQQQTRRTPLPRAPAGAQQ